MKILKSYKGDIESWCYFVNQNKLQQENISNVSMFLFNGCVTVFATYWEEVKEENESIY